VGAEVEGEFVSQPRNSGMHLYKILKTQDTRGELFIPSRFVGRGKFFPDPQVEDPNPSTAAHQTAIEIVHWHGAEGPQSVFIKRYRRNNSDYRIAPAPRFSAEDSSQVILKFTKLGDRSFEVFPIGKDNPEFSSLFRRLVDEGDGTYMESELEALNDGFTRRAMSQRNPLNQILYGPPGTGKTDRVFDVAVEICGLGSKDLDPEIRRRQNRATFKDLYGERIFFITMHPSLSYEDFVVGLRPKPGNDEGIKFDYADGIFKRVVNVAMDLYYENQRSTSARPANREVAKVAFFLSKFNVPPELLASKSFGFESIRATFDGLGKRMGINANYLKNIRDKFDFLNPNDRAGWTPRNQLGRLDNSADWPIQDVFDEMSSKTFEECKIIVDAILLGGGSEVSAESNNSNVVMILDEINRANISKVFGELITLFEGDKRIGQENEIAVQLISGEELVLPPNLFTIGTMNTADRSIALVDIALRRRFQFIPMYPEPSVLTAQGSLIEKERKAEFMVKLNRLLRSNKGSDFQIGHAYFLRDVALQQIINENVLPLLVEYFRNDIEKVRQIMSQIGYEIDQSHFAETGLLKYGD